MFTIPVISVLALSCGANAYFQEYKSAATPYLLSQSRYGNSVTTTEEGYNSDWKARQWEVANGQLRNRNGQCAFPIKADSDREPPIEGVPEPGNQDYGISIQMYPCENGKYNQWSRSGDLIKWRSYCLDNTQAYTDYENPAQLWWCTRDNSNQQWKALYA